MNLWARVDRPRAVIWRPADAGIVHDQIFDLLQTLLAGYQHIVLKGFILQD